MSTTIVQILDRLDAILQTNAPTGSQVFRDRNAAISRDETPCFNTLPKDDEVEPYSSEMDQHQLIVSLEIYVRDDVPTPTLEEQHAAVHRPIVTDPVLLDLCESVRHAGASFTPAEADQDSLCKTVRYRFRYTIPKTTL